MRKEYPLELWLEEAEHSFRRLGHFDNREQVRAAFEQLERIVNTDARKLSYARSPYLAFEYGALRVEDIPRACALVRRVAERGGSGCTHVQRAILGALCRTEDPVLLPFWTSLLRFTRPRDSFATERRRIAVAALAFLMIRRGAGEAMEVMVELLGDADVRVGAEATRSAHR